MQETSFITNHESGKSAKELEKRKNKTLPDTKEGNNNLEQVENNGNIADRLSDIETKLTELEISITNNFNQIINHIQRKEQ